MNLENVESSFDSKNTINNEIDADKIASTSLGSAVCETILPSVPLQPLETIEKSIQKNTVQHFGLLCESFKGI